MVIEVLPLDGVHGTVVWAREWILLAHGPVPVDYICVDGGVLLTVGAAEGPLGAEISLVVVYAVSREEPPAAVNTLQGDVLAPRELIFGVRGLV